MIASRRVGTRCRHCNKLVLSHKHNLCWRCRRDKNGLMPPPDQREAILNPTDGLGEAWAKHRLEQRVAEIRRQQGLPAAIYRHD
jgi:hypothetical protein